MRIALGVQYDGTGWNGWQTQPSKNTVQDCLEGAIFEFTQQPHVTVCAGRTDAGVHAAGQVVHLDTTIDRPEWSWVRGLNALLPATVAVQWAQIVPDDFHARFSARSREYVYRIFLSPIRSPLYDQFAAWVFRPLDISLMQDAARQLLGTHDFSAFRSSECQAVSPVRTLMALDIHQMPCTDLHDGQATIVECRFKANAFLHHMVRNLMGALVEVGRGTRPVSWLTQVLASGDRTLSAPTFAAKGLCLAKVEYDFNLPDPRLGQTVEPSSRSCARESKSVD
jgi:tRNA pseudouridine38-40 synthase